ncbi:MAG: alpha/beta hydrolase [Acidobacteria bacterium]|jgi:pimeloyl-ACP methyl ester carboxylesterase|nr:alpha/beta hydrolase [Acidobacteriota bacterium]
MKKVILRSVMAVAVLIVILLTSGAWLVWKHPLAVDAWMSRHALAREGLHEVTVASPVGAQTVWEGGTGPTLVLLHGAGDQAGTWARVARPLLEHHRLLIPDLAGHGGSEPGRGPLGVDTVLAGLSADIAAQVPPQERIILVGNSLGAWVSMLYAVNHPERVERLILVNGGALRGSHDPSILLPKDRAAARKLMKMLTGPATPPVPDFVLDDVVRWAHRGPVGRLAATADEMDAYVLDGRLSEVEVPVDLLWGDADQLMTLDYAHKMLDGLPAARLTTIHGCGHVPQRECPQRFLKGLDQVLAEAPPSEKP